MFAFRRSALLLALALPAMTAAFAQDSASNPAPAPAQAQAQPEAVNPGQASVQARIRLRRQQRRAQAIHEAYSHRYEGFVGMGYQRFKAGSASNVQTVTTYAWDAALTRFFDERLGVTVDGRGNYGTPYVGLNATNTTRPAISVYSFMAGPTYRFYLQPRYSVGVRVLGGYARGNFTGDTGGKNLGLGLYNDGGSFSVSASLPVEYNVSPNLALRLAPEFTSTGFGSKTQATPGFSAGFVYRFGKK
jgi:opacity protein-like surface antigen